VIGFAGGLPSVDRFPRRELAAAFARSIRRRDVPALQYAWPEGFAPLRERIADRMATRGAKVKADDVIITSGAQQAITIAASLVLRPGAPVGVDAESYPAALDTFRTLGFTPTPGLAPRVLYRMPAVSNPRGIGMTAHQRRQVLTARRWVIEDDAYGDLRFDGPAPRPLLATARSRVLYVGTFSKTLGPGLRLGFLIVPPSLQARAVQRKASDDLQANSLSQALVEDYLAHHDFDAFADGLRRHYARRAERLMKAVRRHLPSWSFDAPEGGFGLWVRTDQRADETRFLRRAVQAGVSFDPGSPFRCVRSRRGPTVLRLCFSSVREDAMEEGARRLARAWSATTRVGAR
jgi:2-aminoadipate transaminase